jgi:hypothetical protein
MVYAEQLAGRYEHYAVGLDHHYGTRHWRGELAAVRTFMVWIESFWNDDGPSEPPARPDAVSLAGRRGTVRWYDAGSAVLGYPSDLDGCY